MSWMEFLTLALVICNVIIIFSESPQQKEAAARSVQTVSSYSF